MYPVSEVLKEDAEFPIDVYDPFEGFNRSVYKFNAKFDKYILMPVVRGYRTITPDPVEKGVRNFFANILEINNIINSLLQLKPGATARATGRLVINTTVGVLGFWDAATAMGIYRQREDFGQTLGRYGVGSGPFLVIPILGPSNVRDFTGFVADSLIWAEIDPLNFDNDNDLEIPYYLLLGINMRAQQGFQYYETGSPFEYDLVRFLHQKARELEISR